MLPALYATRAPEGIGLVQLASEVVNACHQQACAEGADPAVLSVILFEIADLLDEALHCHIVTIGYLVDLGILPGLVDQYPRIGDKPGCCASYVLVHHVDLLDRIRFHQSAGCMLVPYEDHSFVEFEADGRCALLHGLAGVLDLEKPAVRREYRDPPVICHLSWLHSKNAPCSVPIAHSIWRQYLWPFILYKKYPKCAS